MNRVSSSIRIILTLDSSFNVCVIEPTWKGVILFNFVETFLFSSLIYIYMSAIAGQTAGSNELTFFEGTHGCPVSRKISTFFFSNINFSKFYFFPNSKQNVHGQTLGTSPSL